MRDIDVQLVLWLDGTPYVATIESSERGKTVSLRKQDRKNPSSCIVAKLPSGVLQCSCADWRFRRKQCKHQDACILAGLLEPHPNTHLERQATNGGQQTDLRATPESRACRRCDW